jgi:hypothetical protein
MDVLSHACSKKSVENGLSVLISKIRVDTTVDIVAVVQKRASAYVAQIAEDSIHSHQSCYFGFGPSTSNQLRIESR